MSYRKIFDFNIKMINFDSLYGFSKLENMGIADVQNE